MLNGNFLYLEEQELVLHELISKCYNPADKTDKKRMMLREALRSEYTLTRKNLVLILCFEGYTPEWLKIIKQQNHDLLNVPHLKSYRSPRFCPLEKLRELLDTARLAPESAQLLDDIKYYDVIELYEQCIKAWKEKVSNGYELELQSEEMQ